MTSVTPSSLVVKDTVSPSSMQSLNSAFKKFTPAPASPCKKVYKPLHAATIHLPLMTSWMKYLQKEPDLADAYRQASEGRSFLYRRYLLGSGTVSNVFESSIKVPPTQDTLPFSALKCSRIAKFSIEKSPSLDLIQKKTRKNLRRQIRETRCNFLDVMRETNFLNHLQQYNIPHLPPIFDFTITYPYQICFRMPIIGLSLATLICLGRRFTLPEMRLISRQLFETLEVLCEIFCIHGDLKPANICLSTFKEGIKVIDWGLAQFSTNITDRNIQTRWYRAPEVAGKKSFGVAADWWSAGCLLFEVFTLQVLFPSSSDKDHLSFIYKTLDLPLFGLKPVAREDDEQIRSFKEKGVQPEAKDPITGWILKVAKERKEPLPEAKAFAEMLRSLLTYEPFRPIPVKILQHPFIKG